MEEPAGARDPEPPAEEDPMSAIGSVLGLVLLLFGLVMVARLIVDWAGVLGNPRAEWLVGARRVTHAITEPVIAPVRRVLPPVGAGGVSIDLAFTLVFVAVWLLRSGRHVVLTGVPRPAGSAAEQVVELALPGAVQPRRELGAGEAQHRAGAVLGVAHLDHAVVTAQLDAGPLLIAGRSLDPRRRHVDHSPIGTARSISSDQIDS
jgi:YggT family protein